MAHGSNVLIRRLTLEDLPAAMTIQSDTYPAFLREDKRAFASRLAVANPYCLTAMVDGTLAGYLLAHGWPSRSPPDVGAVLSRDAPSEILFIHDLAIGAAGRGQALGGRLVASAIKLAVRDGLRESELIAVEGAASYWRSLGFSEIDTSASLGARVAKPGPDARFMRRELASDLAG